MARLLPPTRFPSHACPPGASKYVIQTLGTLAGHRLRGQAIRWRAEHEKTDYEHTTSRSFPVRNRLLAHAHSSDNLYGMSYLCLRSNFPSFCPATKNDDYMTVESAPAELRLRKLCVGYHRGQPVLEGLSLDIVPGEVFGVVGPNGSGKTTLFRTLLGVLPPVGGVATVSGTDPDDYRRRYGVGYLAEDTMLPPGWTCDGLLALAATAAGPDANVERACRLAGLDYEMYGLVDALSKGMRRRLALAIAVMRSTALLFLDEPESGLDPGQRIRLRRRIEEIRGQTTILVASHDLGELAMMADRVLLVDLGRGRIVQKPEGGFTRERLEKEFLKLEGAVS